MIPFTSPRVPHVAVIRMAPESLVFYHKRAFANECT